MAYMKPKTESAVPKSQFFINKPKSQIAEKDIAENPTSPRALRSNKPPAVAAAGRNWAGTG